MESNGGAGGVGAAAMTRHAIPSQPATLADFFLATDNANNHSAANNDEDPNNTLNHPCLNSGLTIADVLSIDTKKKQPHHRLFARSKPSPNPRFFRNPRVAFSGRSKVSINQIFSREKNPPPKPSSPPYKPLFLRSLLSNIRNNEMFRIRSVLGRKPSKFSKLDPKSNEDQVCKKSYSNGDECQTVNHDTSEEIRQSVKGGSFDDDESFRGFDFDEFSDDADLNLMEVTDDQEGSQESCSGLKLQKMEEMAKKERSQRKFSREVFVLWCLFVGSLSFLLFLFFAYSNVIAS